MKKETKPKAPKVNVDLIKSVVGKSKFYDAVEQELYAGSAPQEAPELVARRIAREQAKNQE